MKRKSYSGTLVTSKFTFTLTTIPIQCSSETFQLAQNLIAQQSTRFFPLTIDPVLILLETTLSETLGEKELIPVGVLLRELIITV